VAVGDDQAADHHGVLRVHGQDIDHAQGVIGSGRVVEAAGVIAEEVAAQNGGVRRRIGLVTLGLGPREAAVE